MSRQVQLEGRQRNVMSEMNSERYSFMRNSGWNQYVQAGHHFCQHFLSPHNTKKLNFYESTYRTNRTATVNTSFHLLG